SGRYSQAGITPIAVSRDTAGPMARCVADVALLDEVIAGAGHGTYFPSPRQLRFGLERSHFWADLDAAVSAVMGEALERLAGEGIELVEVAMPGFAELNKRVGFPVSIYEARRELAAY